MENKLTSKQTWRERLENTSIASRLKGLGLIAILMVILVGFVAVNGMSRLGADLTSVTIAGQALRNHLEGDMMHDAIRGDVLGALGGMAAERDTQEQLRTHVEWFRAAVKKNQALELDPETRALLGQSSAKLESYVSTAQEICSLAYSNSRLAKQRLARFDAAFTEVEKQNEALSDRIEKGAVEAEHAAKADAEWMRNLVMLIGVGGSALLFLIAAWTGRSVTRSIGNMVGTLEQVAEGRLNRRAAESGGAEVARMAAALNQALEKIGATLSLIKRASRTIHASSQSLTSRNEQISAVAESTATSASQLSQSGEVVSERLNAVSASGLELSASVREISTQASSAAGLAQKASTAANSANSLFAVLETTNQEIGNVVAVISSIADQTNLLALNAAIEAARAGDAGRGFAVVAAEVKDLASQTSQATEEISNRISGIQTQTTRAVEAIRALTGIIESVNNVSTTIAAAVEEQTAVTKGIEEQLHDASNSTQDIAASVGTLAENAGMASRNASESLAAARDLHAIAESLQSSVEVFELAE